MSRFICLRDSGEVLRTLSDSTNGVQMQASSSTGRDRTLTTLLGLEYGDLSESQTSLTAASANRF